MDDEGGDGRHWKGGLKGEGRGRDFRDGLVHRSLASACLSPPKPLCPCPVVCALLVTTICNGIGHTDPLPPTLII